ncbi:glycosyltransferase [Inhella proteolytica]|uniref:Glycosyltransferase n=1 Tax=Inhella proteolytica TaxID=2795029 RepID=A0A931J562_9BURK|nr:glycosyltransferase [Inhella proteolytica]MBH9578008.1 glycosyltransferase [Inhella proteolytica]
MKDPVAGATAAVLVVYHLQSQPGPIVERLLAQLGVVVLVDNAPAGHPALALLPAHPHLLRIANANRGGLAGAYNRAIERLRAERPDIQQIVFVDEDSEVDVLPALLADPAVRELLADEQVAAVAPAYRDRATGLRGKHLQFESRWRLRYLPREVEGLHAVAFVINSMSVWRMAALQRLGPYDEGLRIDHVDTEYCLRAHRASLKVMLHGGHSFGHRIGERRVYKLLGVQLQAGGHSPARRYLIARNTLWLARHSLWREPGFAWLCLLRLGYEAVGILMAEPQKLAKLGALLRGCGVGLLSRRLA